MVENHRRRGNSFYKGYKRSNGRKANKGFQPIILLLFGVATIVAIKNLDRDKLPPEMGNIQRAIDRIIPDSLPTDFPNFDFNEPSHPIAGNPILAKETNYAEIDRIARSIDYRGNSVTELANILSRQVGSERDKARTIYSWIANNIKYDAVSFLDGSYVYKDASPEAVLSNRLTVCSGYANLFRALAEAMNLEAAVVEGYAKGDGYGVSGDKDVNHAWNAVKIDNAWYLVDVTWGAGILSGNAFQAKFNPYYFATAPQQLIYSHYPAKEKWQLLSQPYSRATFESLPKVFSHFFKHGLEFVSHKTQKIQANGRLEVILNAPSDTLVSAQLMSGSSRLNDSYTFVQRQGDKIVVSVSAPASGNYELAIFAKNKADSGNYYQAIAYNFQSTGTGEDFPKTYATFIEKGVYLHAPNVRYLPKNSVMRFQLSVAGAEEVVAIDDSDEWTKLDRSGDTFSGNVIVKSGKIRIAAKFPNSSQYAVLLEYD